MTGIQINQGTQTDIYTENAGTVEIGAVKLDLSAQGTYGVSMFQGTIIEVTSIANLNKGTVTRLGQGSINITAGTITAGTVNTGTINAGTINTGTINLGTFVGKDANAAAQVGNPLAIAGTDGGGTVYTFKTDTKGQVYLGGGTVDTLTTIANITNGSVRITVGTITVLPNLPQGSINVTAGTVTAGTVNTGTVNTGTINVATVTAGTINAGTVNAGTINAGTFALNPKPSVVVNAFATTTNATIGTIIAAPSAGSAIFITSLDISVQSGTVEPVVSFGLAANGNQVISRGMYVPGGGIAKTYIPANSGSATGTALTWNVLTSSGTVSYNLAYFVAIP